jgi:hypothetical protein
LNRKNERVSLIIVVTVCLTKKQEAFFDGFGSLFFMEVIMSCNIVKSVCGLCCTATMVCMMNVNGIPSSELCLIDIDIHKRSLVFNLEKLVDGSCRPRLIWGDYGPEATFDEYCESNPHVLPTTEQEIRDLHSLYHSIINAGNNPKYSDFFYDYAHRFFTEIEFACFKEQKLPTVFFPKIQNFINLLSVPADDAFRGCVISKLASHAAVLTMRFLTCCEKCDTPFYVSCLEECSKLNQMLSH